MLDSEESSVEIVYESSERVLEDMMRLPRVNDHEYFPSSNISVAFLDLSIENQKVGYIKPNRIIS